ncbi:MAG: hypothetical protein A4E38_00320 [Methanoregulaceae archaeon PtaB.Bin108]|nr:MAG: hypothetical protein A4E38_00320 [Methanoregulaceae archaeon PtaB.Bin108]OPY41838.1 MAG: hypothetical protein A4E42_01722 [Methanoregulaceae archaeon PtaU1.Bin222]
MEQSLRVPWYFSALFRERAIRYPAAPPLPVNNQIKTPRVFIYYSKIGGAYWLSANERAAEGGYTEDRGGFRVNALLPREV